MKKLLLYSIPVIAALYGCRQSASPTNDGMQTDTAFKQMPPGAIDTQNTDTTPAMDTTRLVVDSMVNITLNGTALPRTENNVYTAVYNNWLQAYQRTKHLPAALKMSTIGTVMMGARGNIMDDIVKAQTDMQNAIAKDVYSKPYGALNASEKDSLQKQHTILFQKDFH